MTEEHEHQWALSTLGTGNEHCVGCGQSRSRRPSISEDEELRFRAAEEGFRNGAIYVAESLDNIAAIAEERVREHETKAKGFREAAKHIRLIAKGRDPA